MELRIFQPEGYSFGAFKVEASLSGDEAEAYAVWPISFHLPELPKRLIHTPLTFVVAASTEAGTKLRGIFVNGKWESHVYSNGIAEEENPTKIGDVETELRKAITTSIKLAVYEYAQSKRWRSNT